MVVFVVFLFYLFIFFFLFIYLFFLFYLFIYLFIYFFGGDEGRGGGRVRENSISIVSLKLPELYMSILCTLTVWVKNPLKTNSRPQPL